MKQTKVKKNFGTMSSKLNRENSALKLKGAGDGVINKGGNVSGRPSERVPVPSSRKFTATLNRGDESVQLKLKKVLDDLEAKQNRQLKRTKTVAEITPTKSTRKKVRRPDAEVSSGVALHATPRIDFDAKRASGLSDGERRQRLEMLVFRRFLLYVWRRSKTRLTTQAESLRRRQEQIYNLEQQVNCLKDLTQSECHKRGEAMGEYQKMESVLHSLRMENNALIGEKATLQSETDELRNKLNILCIESENIKNEINTKSLYLKKLECELQKERTFVRRVREENENFYEEVKAREIEMKEKDLEIAKLTENLKQLEKRLQDCEDEKKSNEIEWNSLIDEFKFKAKNYDCVRHELSRVYTFQDELKMKIESLENKLIEATCEGDIISKENKTLKKEIEERKCWWKNAKELMTVSWAVLQNAAYLMLPAL